MAVSPCCVFHNCYHCVSTSRRRMLLILGSWIWLYTCRSPCWCDAYEIFFVYRVVLALDLLLRRCLVRNCIFGVQMYIEMCMLKILLHYCTVALLVDAVSLVPLAGHW